MLSTYLEISVVFKIHKYTCLHRVCGSKHFPVDHPGDLPEGNVKCTSKENLAEKPSSTKFNMFEY